MISLVTNVERERIAAVLAGIWREALNVPGVSRTDDFFDLGGNSLQAIQIVSRVGDALELELSVECVERFSSFGAFCDFVMTTVGGRKANDGSI